MNTPTPEAKPVPPEKSKPTRKPSRWIVRGLLFCLGASLIANLVMYYSFQEYFAAATPPQERYYSGSKVAQDKIAVINVTGTIMPPFTERTLKAIKRAQEDDSVKGVLLVVDSPGGLVADSHQIYHELVKLREKKPIAVSMKRMAASGGYYISMGAGPEGKIFAEPTTWTGSIGVIIPRYNAQELAGKVGIESEPLTTGPFKDALSPFRTLGEEEQKIWKAILDESYGRFLGVIDENRSQLSSDGVKALATGQIYTADQAKQNGLVDEIGFEEDALKSLQDQLGLSEVRVVRYQFPQTLMDALLGSAKAQTPENQWQMMAEATVPRAMYYFSWGLGLPGFAPEAVNP